MRLLFVFELMTQRYRVWQAVKRAVQTFFGVEKCNIMVMSVLKDCLVQTFFEEDRKINGFPHLFSHPSPSFINHNFCLVCIPIKLNDFAAVEVFITRLQQVGFGLVETDFALVQFQQSLFAHIVACLGIFISDTRSLQTVFHSGHLSCAALALP